MGGDKVKCPYCNNEMVKGVVEAGRAPLKWIEDGGKIGLANRIAIAVDEKHIIAQGRNIESYKCKACNKIVINLK